MVGYQPDAPERGTGFFPVPLNSVWSGPTIAIVLWEELAIRVPQVTNGILTLVGFWRHPEC